MPDSTPPADADDPLPTGIPSARVQLRSALAMGLAAGSPCVSVPLYLDEVRALLTALTDNDKLRERVREVEFALAVITRFAEEEGLIGGTTYAGIFMRRNEAIATARRALKKEGSQS